MVLKMTFQQLHIFLVPIPQDKQCAGLLFDQIYISNITSQTPIIELQSDRDLDGLTTVG